MSILIILLLLHISYSLAHRNNGTVTLIELNFQNDTSIFRNKTIALFNSMDSNFDHELSYSEFYNGMSSIITGTNRTGNTTAVPGRRDFWSSLFEGVGSEYVQSSVIHQEWHTFQMASVGEAQAGVQQTISLDSFTSILQNAYQRPFPFSTAACLMAEKRIEMCFSNSNNVRFLKVTQAVSTFQMQCRRGFGYLYDYQVEKCVWNAECDSIAACYSPSALTNARNSMVLKITEWIGVQSVNQSIQQRLNQSSHGETPSTPHLYASLASLLYDGNVDLNTGDLRGIFAMLDKSGDSLLSLHEWNASALIDPHLSSSSHLQQLWSLLVQTVLSRQSTATPTTNSSSTAWAFLFQQLATTGTSQNQASPQIDKSAFLSFFGALSKEEQIIDLEVCEAAMSASLPCFSQVSSTGMGPDANPTRNFLGMLSLPRESTNLTQSLDNYQRCSRGFSILSNYAYERCLTSDDHSTPVGNNKCLHVNSCASMFEWKQELESLLILVPSNTKMLATKSPHSRLSKRGWLWPSGITAWNALLCGIEPLLVGCVVSAVLFSLIILAPFSVQFLVYESALVSSQHNLDALSQSQVLMPSTGSPSSSSPSNDASTCTANLYWGPCMEIGNPPTDSNPCSDGGKLWRQDSCSSYLDFSQGSIVCGLTSTPPLPPKSLQSKKSTLSSLATFGSRKTKTGSAAAAAATPAGYNSWHSFQNSLMWPTTFKCQRLCVKTTPEGCGGF